ncbi:MAG: ORF6N domain-containing protein [Bacteroidota bacterium]|nr:ORF6N domain-containing protein [Bacteroidota bacterium]
MEIATKEIVNRIYFLRGQKVMLDKDLAELYGIETKILNQAVKRNSTRFPEDFMFQVSENEYDNLRSQIVTLDKNKFDYFRFAPNVFTENGVAMLSSVLNSERAIQMNILIMRQFTAMRHILIENKELFIKVIEMEKTLTEHNDQLNTLFSYLKKLMHESTTEREPIGYKLNKKN